MAPPHGVIEEVHAGAISHDVDIDAFPTESAELFGDVVRALPACEQMQAALRDSAV